MEWVKLDEICTPKQWKTIPQSEFTIDGYPVFGANGKIGYYKDYNHENPTIMITCRGATCGTINISDPYSYITGNAMALDDLDNTKYNLHFIYFYLKHRGLNDTISGSAQPQITRTNLSIVKIPAITIEEQDIIVNKLLKIKDLIQTRQDQVQALDDLVYSVFYNVFGDPASSSNSNKFVKLSDIGTWKSGSTPLRSNHDYYNGSIPWVTSGELNNIYIDDSLEHITEQAIEESSAKLVEPGSLLLGMYDSAGLKSSITTKEMATNQAIAFSKIDSNIANSIFVYTCIQILRPILLTKQRGVRQKNFNLTMIRNIKIILPPIEKQNLFAAFVEKIEGQKQILNDSLDELKNLFDSLMQDAFDGSMSK